MSKIQNFIGVKEYIKKEDFVFNKERGMYCLQPPDAVDGEEPQCSIPDTKGQINHKYLDPVVNAKLHQFFAPFDDYLAQQIRHAKFDWNF